MRAQDREPNKIDKPKKSWCRQSLHAEGDTEEGIGVLMDSLSDVQCG